MATKVILPKQGLQMTEGKITKWLAAEGDRVKAEQPIFEMQTDKVNIEVGAPDSGTLLKILRDVGDVVPVAGLVAVIGEPGEDIAHLLEDPAAEAGAGEVSRRQQPGEKAPADPKAPAQDREEKGRVFITPRAKTLALDAGIDYRQIPGSGEDGLIIERDVKAFIKEAKEEPRATPLAKVAAQQSGVDLREVQGSGAGGKITKADIEEALAARKSGEAAAGRKGRVLPFTGLRKVISENMMKSMHGMVQANHRMKVDMTEVTRFRSKLKESGVKVSYNDIVMKVVAKALLDHPIMNSSLTEEGIHVKDYVNLGIAVAVEDGLLVPVVRDADLMTLEEISRVSAELVDKAQRGKLMPDDYAGGTFTLTNLGMYDVDEFTAVINPPEAGILALGKIDRVPVVEGDSVVIRPVMVLSLTYDHRIVDGAPAARFLKRVKEIMLNPYLLI